MLQKIKWYENCLVKLKHVISIYFVADLNKKGYMKFIFKRYAEIKVQFSFNQANHKTDWFAVNPPTHTKLPLPSIIKVYSLCHHD